MGLHLNRMDVPQWLEDLLEKTPTTQAPTLALLKGMKDAAMRDKMADVENYNLSVNSRLRRRLPERLEPLDVAAILSHLFIFKSVTMAQRADAGTLSVYVPGTSDIWSKINRGTSEGLYVEASTFVKYLATRLSVVKTREIDEVVDLLTIYAPVTPATTDKHMIPVNNGVYNKQTNTFESFTPDYVFTKKIGVNFNPTGVNPTITMPDGKAWDVESWLKELSVSADVNTLFWQVISAAIQPNSGMNKSVWFYSESGNNGKGTVGQLIKNLIGEGNYSSLPVVDFNHEFKKEALLTAVANIADENNVDAYIDSVMDYKASVTGDDIIVNRKNRAPVRLQFRGLNIQMMNGLPKTKDKTGSFYRRILIVPFIKSFTNNGERGYIKTDYINRQDVLEYVLSKALMMDFDEFIVPKESVAALEQYKEKNNPVIDFWNELKGEFKWDLLPNQFLYDLYKKWFERNNPSGKVIQKREFLPQLGTVIDADGEWENRIGSDKKNVASLGRMDDDEPLITEYGLDRAAKNGAPSEWMNQGNYDGANLMKRRNFKRKVNYRGLKRI